MCRLTAATWNSGLVMFPALELKPRPSLCCTAPSRVKAAPTTYGSLRSPAHSSQTLPLVLRSLARWVETPALWKPQRAHMLSYSIRKETYFSANLWYIFLLTINQNSLLMSRMHILFQGCCTLLIYPFCKFSEIGMLKNIYIYLFEIEKNCWANKGLNRVYRLYTV